MLFQVCEPPLLKTAWRQCSNFGFYKGICSQHSKIVFSTVLCVDLTEMSQVELFVLKLNYQINELRNEKMTLNFDMENRQGDV